MNPDDDWAVILKNFYKMKLGSGSVLEIRGFYGSRLEIAANPEIEA